MLGEAVYKEFSAKSTVLATDIDLNESWLSLLDVRNTDDVSKVVSDFRPDYIIHLAALTDMEFCERNIENAYKTNTESVLFLSREALKRNIPFLYISTAGIFDGEKDVYVEEDIPNPLSVYGKSKYFGELVARSIPKSIVIRAGWMMGGGPKKDKKFINKIVKQLNQGSKKLHVVSDKHGTPCYTYDLARSMFYLLNEEKYGLYHGTCDGSGSRLDVARLLVENLGLSKDVEIVEVDSDYYKKDYFAPRPFSEKLENRALKALSPGLTRDWRICLKEYVEKYYRVA